MATMGFGVFSLLALRVRRAGFDLPIWVLTLDIASEWSPQIFLDAGG
jgi:hypothetical protein